MIRRSCWRTRLTTLSLDAAGEWVGPWPSAAHGPWFPLLTSAFHMGGAGMMRSPSSPPCFGLFPASDLSPLQPAKRSLQVDHHTPEKKKKKKAASQPDCGAGTPKLALGQLHGNKSWWTQQRKWCGEHCSPGRPNCHPASRSFASTVPAPRQPEPITIGPLSSADQQHIGCWGPPAGIFADPLTGEGMGLIAMARWPAVARDSFRSLLNCGGYMKLVRSMASVGRADRRPLIRASPQRAARRKRGIIEKSLATHNAAEITTGIRAHLRRLLDLIKIQ